jgi:hypothetical protein
VLDASLGVALLQEATRYVVRVAKNKTFRRATPPSSARRGRPPTRRVVVRPLPHRSMSRTIPTTPPNDSVTWHDDGVLVQADLWSEAEPADRRTRQLHVHRQRRPRPAPAGAVAPGLAPPCHLQR